MAAADKTIRKIVEVLDRHIKDKVVIADIARDLTNEVTGNEAVRDTLKKLYKAVK